MRNSYACNLNSTSKRKAEVLTVKRKLLILRHRNESRSQYQAQMIGSDEWIQDLFQHMSTRDGRVSLLDVKRWCRNYAWITDHHQIPRGMRRHWPWTPPAIPLPWANNEVVIGLPDQRPTEFEFEDVADPSIDRRNTTENSGPAINTVCRCQDPPAPPQGQQEEHQEEEDRQGQNIPESTTSSLPKDSKTLKHYHKIVKGMQCLRAAFEKYNVINPLSKKVTHMYRVMERTRSKHIVAVTHKTALEKLLYEEAYPSQRTKMEGLVRDGEHDYVVIDEEEINDSESIQQLSNSDSMEFKASPQDPREPQDIETIDLSADD